MRIRLAVETLPSASQHLLVTRPEMKTLPVGIMLFILVGLAVKMSVLVLARCKIILQAVIIQGWAIMPFLIALAVPITLLLGCFLCLAQAAQTILVSVVMLVTTSPRAVPTLTSATWAWPRTPTSSALAPARPRRSLPASLPATAAG